MPASITPPSEQPGQRIGHYKLLQQIGEGGFGVVWMAEQEQKGSKLLAIPHNSNLGNGAMFVPLNEDGSPLTASDAAFRAAMEPVVEITQHKGDSECRAGAADDGKRSPRPLSLKSSAGRLHAERDREILRRHPV